MGGNVYFYERQQHWYKESTLGLWPDSLNKLLNDLVDEDSLGDLVDFPSLNILTEWYRLIPSWV